MTTSVEVLCLNGRRQTVKINNNTTLLQILEDVCKKQGYIPSADYNLQRGRQVLDLSLPFRFSNLPNNAKLELVKAEQSRPITNVHVALSVPSGERHEHEFPPTTSLWAILQHWDKTLERPFASHFARIDTTMVPFLHPVCIHMREEVVGQFALENTTLYHLGLLAGRALIRLTYRPVDESSLAMIHAAVERRLKQETKTDNVPSHSASINLRPSSTLRSLTSASRGTQRDDNHISVGTSIDDSAINLCGTQTVTPLRSTSEFSIHHHPAQNALSVQQPLWERDDDSEVDMEPGPSTNIVPRIGIQMPIQDFKFPVETKGKDLYHNEFQNTYHAENQSCDRQMVVFNQDDVTTSEEVLLPDEFFDVTEEDLKSMMAEQKRQIKLLQDQPLMTKSMRLHELEHKVEKYNYAVIRIYFPDKNILQARFNKKENIHALYKFVRMNLHNAAQDFYLYTTPPKQILKDFSHSMIEASLVPTAKVYFGCKCKQGRYLSDYTMTALSSPSVAFSIASMSSVAVLEDVKSPSATSQYSVHKPKKDAGTKVPRWFYQGMK